MTCGLERGQLLDVKTRRMTAFLPAFSSFDAISLRSNPLDSRDSAFVLSPHKPGPVLLFAVAHSLGISHKPRLCLSSLFLGGTVVGREQRTIKTWCAPPSFFQHILCDRFKKTKILPPRPKQQRSSRSGAPTPQETACTPIFCPNKRCTETHPTVPGGIEATI